MSHAQTCFTGSILGFDGMLVKGIGPYTRSFVHTSYAWLPGPPAEKMDGSKQYFAGRRCSRDAARAGLGWSRAWLVLDNGHRIPGTRISMMRRVHVQNRHDTIFPKYIYISSILYHSVYEHSYSQTYIAM